MARAKKETPRGFVISARTFNARQDEIAKWKDHPWYHILMNLDFALSFIDTEYELLQVKEKFGELRYYFSTRTGRRDEMAEIVWRAEQEIKALQPCKGNDCSCNDSLKW